MMQAQRGRLRDGVAELGLSLPDAALDQLLGFATELLAWNKRINLTAITDPQQVVIQHLLDSLAVLPFVSASRILDVGSGGGLPGVVLAIARPEIRVFSIESRHKKVAFQRHAARQLGLSNFFADAQRIEQWQPEAPFDQVISRAFSSLGDFIRLAGRHLSAGGELLAMKGKLPSAELPMMPQGWQLVKMPRLIIPGMQAERHLAILRQSSQLD